MAKINSGIRDWNYRHYVANSLMGLSRGSGYSMTLYDMFNQPPADNRTGDEIAADVMQRAGLKFKE